jgi:glycosyltransferase involved in cell wall biosynthesis
VRILYVVERFWPYIGGVEVVSAGVLPRLAERGHEVTVLTSRDDPELPEQDEFHGVAVRRLPMSRALRDNDLGEIASILEEVAALRRELSPHVVHVLFTGPGIFFPVMSATRNGAPWLLSFHGSWPTVHPERHGLLRRAIDRSAWITACSKASLAEIHAWDGTLRAKSSSLLNGLDPREGEPRPPVVDPPVLFCAARLTQEKGMDVAIDALGLLAVDFPSIRLVLAGDGPHREELEAQVSRLGLGDSVEFTGWKSPDEIAELIDAASAVLVPSRLEGFGLTALQGMLGGRPVVASDVGGLPEVLGEDGGVLVPPERPDALAAAVGMLLRDPGLARRTGEAGRRRAERFSLDRCVDEHENLYRRLMEGARAH